MIKKKAMTWEELAQEYKKETGQFAMVRPMDFITKWAESRPDRFFYNKREGTFHLKKDKVKKKKPKSKEDVLIEHIIRLQKTLVECLMDIDQLKKEVIKIKTNEKKV
jgi:hypothetical protein